MTLRRAKPFWAKKKAGGGGSTPFISTWNTANTSTGSSANNQVRLPLLSIGAYDFSVDWGDGNSDIITAWDQVETTHTYASSGVYTISITGGCAGWAFRNLGDKLKITDISQWGSLEFLNNTDSNSGFFYGCANLQVSATDTPIFQGSFAGMFRSCTALTGSTAFNSWNTTPAISIANCFESCVNFNQPIENWDVSNVTDFTTLFSGCTTFNQNLSAWNVGSGQNFGSMFRSCTAFNNGGNSGINGWNMSSAVSLGVGNGRGMFQSAVNFNQPIGSWDVSNVADFGSMFQSATSFNQDISGWNMSSATSLLAMFQSANSFNQNIGAWNVSNVTTMQNLFFGNTAFNNAGSDSIKNWNVSKVTNFISCFRGANAFNQPIGDWVLNTVSNISMNSIFRDNTVFNQNIGTWNVSKVTDFTLFMNAKTAANFSAANLDAIYNGWSALPTLSPNEAITFGTAKYTAAGQAGRDILTGTYGWTITDGGI